MYIWHCPCTEPLIAIEIFIEVKRKRERERERESGEKLIN